MSKLPVLNSPAQSRQYLQDFRGYNASLRISDSEWAHTRNLSNREYPVLSTRKRRGEVRTLTAPGGCIAKDVPYYIDGSTLYVNGVATALQGITPVTVTRSATAPSTPSEGQYWYDTTRDITFVRSASLWMPCAYPQKQLVSMGAYIVIFPDRLYYNTQDPSDSGSIDAEFSFSASAGTPVEYTPVTSDGAAISASVSSEAPANPTSGQYWMDTSVTPHALKVWSSAQQEWSSIATTYVRISVSGADQLLSTGDAVEISGAAVSGSSQITDLNGSHVIQNVTSEGFTVVGLLDSTARQTSGTLYASRTAPDMDYVCECQNRLWGCKYGIVDGKPVNELYCSKLGDFKNWRVYAGISTDSWAASVGSDGPWTGAICYLNHPTFFKEDRIHRITVSAVGAHSVTDVPCRGVQLGSARSLAMAGEILYYKSPTGVCSYDGSLPVDVGGALGERQYAIATGFGIGDYYYISMRDEDGWSLFVLDTKRGLWIREDESDVINAVQVNTDIWYVDARDLKFRSLWGTSGTVEEDISWEAVTGVIGYETPDKKYLSRFDFRIKCPEMQCFIEYDSSGDWVPHGEVSRETIGTFVLPVRPRRCDHLRIKLVGHGDMNLYSIAKILEVGSDA